MSVSSFEGDALYVVQVRHGDSYREQVGSCEFPDFFGARECAGRLARWLAWGHDYGVPPDALDLPDELGAQGIDPRACVVEVVRLPAAGPGRYDALGTVLCTVADHNDDDPDDADVVLEPTDLADGSAVTVRVPLR
ncbi:MAG TPA: hypothetical protein VGE74_22785 [Gemmata sp.]